MPKTANRPLHTMRIVAHNIRTIRQMQQRSQTDVAVNADLSQSYLGRIEQELVDIRIETLGNIATSLQVDAADLLALPDRFRPGREIPMVYREFYARLPKKKQQLFCNLLSAIIAFKEKEEE